MDTKTRHLDPLELFLFTTNLCLAQEAERAGVDSIVVDWEQKGKRHRQRYHNTEINANTPKEVNALARLVRIPITVRINPLDDNTAQEIAIALDAGAKILMLPMAQKPHEVEKFLQLVNNRAKTIIQIETDGLVRQCQAIRDLDWSYAYIGLNDLMIARQKTRIWDFLADGTVEDIMQNLAPHKVGFGGITRIGGGNPLPFIELLYEMARLNCSLSVLRRTFKREIIGRNLSAEIQAIRAVWIAAKQRNQEAVQQDYLTLIHRLTTTS